MGTVDMDGHLLLREAAKLWSFLYNFDSFNYQSLSDDVVTLLSRFRWLVVPRHQSDTSFSSQLDASAEHTLRYILKDESAVLGTTYKNLCHVISQINDAAAAAAVDDDDVHQLELSVPEIALVKVEPAEDIVVSNETLFESMAKNSSKTDDRLTSSPVESLVVKSDPDVDSEVTDIEDQLATESICEDVNRLETAILRPSNPDSSIAGASARRPAYLYRDGKKRGRMRYECAKCNGRTFANRSSLQRHQLLHSGERPFSCEICAKTFNCRGNRDKHRHRMHPEGSKRMTSPCPFCGKTFSDQTYLKTHIRGHSLNPGQGGTGCTGIGSGVRKNIIVGKRLLESVVDMDGDGRGIEQNDFIGKRLLDSEAGIDLNGRACMKRSDVYVCPVCGREFVFLSTMKVHVLSHTNERPFVCELCGKSFKWHGDLTVHAKHHKPKKNLACTYCNRMFGFKSGLVRHLRVHTLERPYLCMECGRAFGGHSNYRKHMMVHARRSAAEALATSEELSTVSASMTNDS